MKVTNIKLGCDPELFLEKNNKIVSAEGLIGGTKHKPKLISEEGHAIQEDNVMIEFNIPASSDKKSFKDNINFVISYLETLVSIIGCKLNFSASAILDPRELNTVQSKMFGCEPDYNVYLKKENDSPSSSTTLRTAGGHIHIGYDNPDQETSEEIIYAMDAVLGLESITLDSDDRRRQMYGKAGSFRFKDYGIEYRTLSNFWIKNDELIDWAYEKTLEAIKLVNSGDIKKIINVHAFAIKKCIDSNDKNESILLLNQIKKLIQTVKTK
tara:strand:- start:949 stop:1752 length:804 start_codon:yes stop_codon:yes gene_type:complete